MSTDPSGAPMDLIQAAKHTEFVENYDSRTNVVTFAVYQDGVRTHDIAMPLEQWLDQHTHNRNSTVGRIVASDAITRAMLAADVHRLTTPPDDEL